MDNIETGELEIEDDDGVSEAAGGIRKLTRTELIAIGADLERVCSSRIMNDKMYATYIDGESDATVTARIAAKFPGVHINHIKGVRLEVCGSIRKPKPPSAASMSVEQRMARYELLLARICKHVGLDDAQLSLGIDHPQPGE